MAARNIALNRTGMVAGLTFIVGQLVTFGVFPEVTGGKVVSIGTVVIGAAFTLAAAVHALVGVLIHRQVTPVADPKDNEGNLLVPAPKPSEITYTTAPGGAGDLPNPLGLPA